MRAIELFSVHYRNAAWDGGFNSSQRKIVSQRNDLENEQTEQFDWLDSYVDEFVGDI